MPQIRYSPSDMVKKANFGGVQSVKNKFSGANVPTFVKQFTLHYKDIKRTLTQTYMLQGTELQDTKIIAVRHNSKLVDTMKVQISGDSYDIKDISVDDSNDYITYDLITIAKVKKGGA
ncbi:phage head closure protein [Liquorilactobacillus satsumensis]|uniref:phage head closure protein n=1 Tax=Liquorilactobacillus satsumensis TaxID=259059 RepID=UPI000704FB28|nr:phage head closure protein [Liquorilactobacillus satsumensis]